MKIEDVYCENASPRIRVGNIKLIVSIFLMFLMVVSDIFVDNVVTKFGDSAVKGRAPTSWGIVIQGIFLVIGYILMIYLTEHGIL